MSISHYFEELPTSAGAAVLATEGDDEAESSDAGGAPAEDFASFKLPPALAEALKQMEYKTPTPIQMQAIPPALEGRDILGSAQTGTGKTAAFSVPMVSRLLTNSRGSALVLTPTRELAVQVIAVIHKLLGAKTAIKTALLIGGEPMPNQFRQLRDRPRVIVGTPGRINDHLERGTLMLHDTGMLVLDETDRMLDMGFGVQIDRILKYLPKQRQTMMFSATLPPAIVRMSENYLVNPLRIAVGESNAPAKNVKQEVIKTSEPEKYATLLAQLKQREGSVIIFVKTKFGTEKLANRLRGESHEAEAIHGDLQQRKRDSVIRAFRKQKYRIMVATDVAARGLDIPHIEHVINYDLPQCPEDYIHRIGRTARAGAEGSAVSLVSPEDGAKWRAIQRMLDPESAERERGNDNNRRRSGGGKPGFGGKGRQGGGGKPAHRPEGGGASSGNGRRSSSSSYRSRGAAA
jgi:ATP-dependent RNA helicase DeaD